MKSLILMLTCLLCSAPALAASALGDVSVPVADRSAEQRAEALALGLDQVLVRLTGSRELAGRAGLGSVRQQPSRWATQYRYLQQDDQLLITASFDIDGLLAALQRAGAPVWGTTRPQALTWLVVQRPGVGELLSRDSVDPVQGALRQAAAERGLPLVLPVMDDADRRAIAVADVRGHFDHVMHKASSRYGAPLTLAAVLYTGQSPQIRWRLFRGVELLEQGEVTGVDEPQAVFAMVDRVADLLASVYVIRSGDSAALSLEVRQVSSLAQWHSLQRYLQGLTGVSNVQLRALSGQTLHFSLSFAGELAQLRQLLALNANIAACDALAAPAAAVPAAPVLPSYCWQAD